MYNGKVALVCSCEAFAKLKSLSPKNKNLKWNALKVGLLLLLLLIAVCHLWEYTLPLGYAKITHNI